jgi:hypothetical protein
MISPLQDYLPLAVRVDPSKVLKKLSIGHRAEEFLHNAGMDGPGRSGCVVGVIHPACNKNFFILSP